MKNSTIRKGMVLAAGLGTRLLPITEKYPKPLVPVLNVPNILHSLYLLKRAGIDDIVINLHHLPDVLEKFLGDGSRWDLSISYSREKTLLGTGGGVKKAEAFFDGQPFVLANCDVISDGGSETGHRRASRPRRVATMVLHEDPQLQPFYSEGGSRYDGPALPTPVVQTTEPTRTGLFTGIHVLSSAIFKYLKETPSGINDVLYPQIMKEMGDRVRGVFTKNAYWYDTGERTTLWNASMRLLERMHAGDTMLRDFLVAFGNYEEREKGVWMVRGEKKPANVALMPPLVIGSRCQFGEGVILGPKSLIGDDSHVGAGTQVTEFVALGAARIPAAVVARDGLQFEALTLSTSEK